MASLIDVVGRHNQALRCTGVLESMVLSRISEKVLEEAERVRMHLQGMILRRVDLREDYLYDH